MVVIRSHILEDALWKMEKAVFDPKRRLDVSVKSRLQNDQ